MSGIYLAHGLFLIHLNETPMVASLDHHHQGLLEEILRQRIIADGPLPFSEFMEACLYHPEYGYYMVARQRIGRDGDFFTSSSVHAIFGQLIARQLRQIWEILGTPDNFIIAEQGAGSGHLCLDILNALEKDSPDFYSSLKYSIVEISADNRARQAELLSRHQKVVNWCMKSELQGMVGCYLSNELVDAFPVHLVEMRDGRLQEVFVTVVDNSFQEILCDISTPELSGYLDWVGVDLADGNRAEINLVASSWMREVASLLHRGFVLTIDYGYLAGELYAPWRTSGTLLCYYQHTTSDNPYIRIGEQDITAHVDYTALMKAGEDSGLRHFFYGDQCKFLLGLGFVEALLAAQAVEKDEHHAQALRLTLKNLILPDGGMGDLFKVLIQGKAVEPQTLLCARSLRDIPLPLPCL